MAAGPRAQALVELAKTAKTQERIEHVEERKLLQLAAALGVAALSFFAIPFGGVGVFTGCLRNHDLRWRARATGCW
jgi:hypothetical protein